MRNKARWFALLAMVVIGVGVSTAYWWNSWPDRTREKIWVLIERENLRGLQEMFSGATWSQSAENKWAFKTEEAHVIRTVSHWKELWSKGLEPRERTLEDRIAGRTRFDLLVLPVTQSPLSPFDSAEHVAAYQFVLTIERGKASVLAEVVEIEYAPVDTFSVF